MLTKEQIQEIEIQCKLENRIYCEFCGKTYYYLQTHWLERHRKTCKENPDREVVKKEKPKAESKYRYCQYCNKRISNKDNIHETHCKENPDYEEIKKKKNRSTKNRKKSKEDREYNRQRIIERRELLKPLQDRSSHVKPKIIYDKWRFVFYKDDEFEDF